MVAWWPDFAFWGDQATKKIAFFCVTPYCMVESEPCTVHTTVALHTLMRVRVRLNSLFAASMHSLSAIVHTGVIQNYSLLKTQYFRVGSVVLSYLFLLWIHSHTLATFFVAFLRQFDASFPFGSEILGGNREGSGTFVLFLEGVKDRCNTF